MSILADDELAIATELIDQLVDEELDTHRLPERAADLELLALSTQTPFCWPGSPPELAHALVRALGRRGDELAAGVLAGMACLASEPLAGMAGAEARRLAGRGVVSPHADAIGRLDVVEACRLELADGEAEIWLALLGRPGTDDVQPTTVYVEHGPSGSSIVGASLGAPMERDSARSLLDRPEQTPRPLRAEDLAGRLRAALDAMVRDEVGLDVDAGLVLPLLERALTGRAGRLPRPRPEEIDPEEAARDSAEALVVAFATTLEEAGAEAGLLEHGPFVAHTMLEFKLEHADDEFVYWDAGEVREYLLDWFPREVTCDDATIGVVTDAVVAFLGFLDEEDLLESPSPLRSLGTAVRRLGAAFERACRDPHRWGPAKRLALEMLEDGVEITDTESADAWIASYNARLSGERSAPPRPSPDGRRREQRKAARQARKRNRR